MATATKKKAAAKKKAPVKKKPALSPEHKLFKELIDLKKAGQIDLNCDDARRAWRKVRAAVGETTQISNATLNICLHEFGLAGVEDDAWDTSNYDVVVKDKAGKVLFDSKAKTKRHRYDYLDVGDVNEEEDSDY